MSIDQLVAERPEDSPETTCSPSYVLQDDTRIFLSGECLSGLASGYLGEKRRTWRTRLHVLDAYIAHVEEKLTRRDDSAYLTRERQTMGSVIDELKKKVASGYLCRAECKSTRVAVQDKIDKLESVFSLVGSFDAQIVPETLTDTGLPPYDDPIVLPPLPRTTMHLGPKSSRRKSFLNRTLRRVASVYNRVENNMSRVEEAVVHGIWKCNRILARPHHEKRALPTWKIATSYLAEKVHTHALSGWFEPSASEPSSPSIYQRRPIAAACVGVAGLGMLSFAPSPNTSCQPTTIVDTYTLE